MNNSIIEKDMEDYFLKVSSQNSKESEDLLEKVSKSYCEIIKLQQKVERDYILVIALFGIMKLFNIQQIELLGVSLKQIPLTPLFLIVSSYLFYRYTSISIHKGHLYKMYAILSEKTDKILYKKMYHYFFIPNSLGLIEEIYELKFNLKNAHMETIQDFKTVLFFVFVFALSVINIFDVETIENSDVKSWAFVYIGMAISIVFTIIAIKNLYHFVKVSRIKKEKHGT